VARRERRPREKGVDAAPALADGYSSAVALAARQPQQVDR
jgi:hypothetical protein